MHLGKITGIDKERDSKLVGILLAARMLARQLRAARHQSCRSPSSITKGIRSRGMDSNVWRRDSRSMLPLKGWSKRGWRPSRMTISCVSAPRFSIWARVVFEWVLERDHISGLGNHCKEDVGCALPVGRYEQYLKPMISWTAAWNHRTR